MKTKITLAQAQSSSAMATTKTVAGIKVYPVAYGHIYWLRDLRKNKILAGKDENDFAMAEICFAFTNDALSLQRLTGAPVTKRINDLLMGNSVATLSSLFEYAAEQLSIHIKTLVSPKKPTAQVSRKPAARVRKR